MFDLNEIYHSNKHIEMPQWAKDMVNELCQMYDKPRPDICWLESGTDGYTGGWYAHDTNEIVVVADGNFRTDSHSLAHEFAHYVTNEGHTSTMYMELFNIVERLGISRNYMISIEWDYQPTRFASALMKRQARERYPTDHCR